METSKGGFRMIPKKKRRVPRWFDRMNRYRLAAGFLFIPFVFALLAWAVGVDTDTIMPLVVRQAIYWVGLFLLTVSLAMDAWEVYRGKRKVKRMIKDKLNKDD